MRDKKTLTLCLAALFLLSALGATLAATANEAPPAAPSAKASCPYSGLQCPDVYDPVTCDGGVVYSNACYARRACATGCGSGGS